MALSKILPASQEQYAGARNLITNSAMQVWQRGTTIDTISTGGYLCDRWRIAHTGLDGNVDVDRSTDVPSGQGFGYSQKISMDASETSLDAADQVNIAQRFEGQDLQKLAKGTSSAKSLTLSFWVKSSVASTYSINLYDSDNTRVISASYIVSATNTWEKKTVTFAGDTTGALDNDSARSLDLTFWLDAGTNWTGGTFGTSWAANVNNTRVYDTTGWLESTSPEFYLTGVQLEVGEQATPFEHRSFQDEITRCKRYYQNSFPYGTAPFNNAGQGAARWDERTAVRPPNSFSTSTYIGAVCHLPVTMRATPVTTAYNTNTSGTSGSYLNDLQNSATTTSYAIQSTNHNTELLNFYAGGISGQTNTFGVNWEADAEL